MGDLLKVHIAKALVISLLICACSGGENSRLREIARTRQCRANMNILCTDQAVYHMLHGSWSLSITELDAEADRPVPLVCPADDQEYIMVADSAGYTISCPSGVHGSVATGQPSWHEGSGSD